MSADFEELEGAIGELTASVDKLTRSIDETQAATVALSDEVPAIGDELPTKRELFSALFLVGANASSASGRQQDVKLAVAYADALLAELAKPVSAEGGSNA